MNLITYIIGMVVIAAVVTLAAQSAAHSQFKKGRKAAAAEAKIKEAEQRNEAVRVVNEVKQEVDSEIDTASDDHLVTVAHRWLRPSPTSDTKPN